MFHGVPNTESTLTRFRFDDLAHQHINYFTPANALRLFSKNLYQDFKCKTTHAGNEMHVMARAGQEKRWSSQPLMDTCLDMPVSEIKEIIRKWKLFAKELEHLESNFKRNLTILLRRGSVGFYGGGHALVHRTGMGQMLSWYDGDIIKHGKSWLASLPEIRSPRQLVDDPVSYLIIAPEHYFDAISSQLVSEIKIPKTIQVMRISDLYSAHAEFPRTSAGFYGYK